jgi:hypothetical protein
VGASSTLTELAQQVARRLVELFGVRARPEAEIHHHVDHGATLPHGVRCCKGSASVELLALYASNSTLA